jgi:DNA-binding beta-propeller fold protein YncE
VKIIPAPRALVDGTAPLPGGVIWALYGNRSAMRLGRFAPSAGEKWHSVAVSPTATCVAGSSRGLLALGLARPTTGAVVFLDATTGRRIRSVAVRGPVRALAFGYGGKTLYVLDGTAASMEVTRLSTSSFRVAGAVGVPRDPIGIVPDRSETAVWTLQRSGVLEETSLASGGTLAAFSTGNPAVAVAASPDGDRIYVLKRTATTMNVSIITSATEDVERVIPAALDSVALALSPDGRTLYDFVGTPGYGNIQEINLARGG